MENLGPVGKGNLGMSPTGNFGRELTHREFLVICPRLLDNIIFHSKIIDFFQKMAQIVSFNRFSIIFTYFLSLT